MSEEIGFLHRVRAPDGGGPVRFGPETAALARGFHESLPGYGETALVSLPALAAALGVGGIWVKDESSRFGLGAFKALGGSWCLANCLGERLGVAPGELRFARIADEAARSGLGPLTFVTATDGNHGRGVAWAARIFGQRAVVFMPRGSAPERLENIRAQGAEAAVTDRNYDGTVAMAADWAQAHGGILVQDTSWPGYEATPARIMEGYTTMAAEAVGQLGGVRPTHVFLQAGVGAMAGALADFFAAYYGPDRPVVTIVEPNAANCLFRTARADDGALRSVGGSLSTIMAGLACGVPCSVAWDVLSRRADNFVSIPDRVAAQGMRILASPLGGDRRIVSGESGASAFGFAAELLRNGALAPLREQLGLGPGARLLFFSTEGATDRENYRRVVWDGRFPAKAGLY